MASTINGGFTLVEDEALKLKLQGLIVSDENNAARQVPVRFRIPEKEEATVSYPFIAIELVDIRRATDGREHRGWVRNGIAVAPPSFGAGAFANFDYTGTQFPIPMELIYTVTTFARSTTHDRQLNILLRTNVLPDRFGYLVIPEDNTVRRLDFMGWRPADTLFPDGKRLFRKIYSIMIDAELYLDQITVLSKVRQLNLKQLVFDVPITRAVQPGQSTTP